MKGGSNGTKGPARLCGGACHCGGQGECSMMLCTEAECAHIQAIACGTAHAALKSGSVTLVGSASPWHCKEYSACGRPCHSPWLRCDPGPSPKTSGRRRAALGPSCCASCESACGLGDATLCLASFLNSVTGRLLRWESSER